MSDRQKLHLLFFLGGALNFVAFCLWDQPGNYFTAGLVWGMGLGFSMQ